MHGHRLTRLVSTQQGLQLLLFFFFQSQRTRGHITLYALTSLPSLFFTFQLVSMGSPRLSPNGTLLSAGDDLSQAGLTQYMMDVVFVTWAAQILACAWTKAWWLYASVSKASWLARSCAAETSKARVADILFLLSLTHLW